jgi:hypothetical protein
LLFEQATRGFFLCWYASYDDLYEISLSSDVFFGTQNKWHNFFATFRNASGQKHQQAMAKVGEEGSH